MTKVVYFLLLTVVFFPLSGFAQGNEVKISGKVFDEKTQEPIIGAGILLAGSKGVGTASNADGYFSLNVKSLPATISIEYLGYKKHEVDVYESAEPIIVLLRENTNFLSEVVVVGYGTQKRQDLTGAVSSVPVVALSQQAVSFDKLLGGAVAGLNVTQSSGAPGATSTIRIRGSNSIAGGNEPLYVVDGYILYSDNTATRTGVGGSTSGVGDSGTSGTIDGGLNPLNSINPTDIESIDILKDVSATAIYGSRGANGVIIITTKKGNRGRNKVNYQSTFGTQRISKKLDLLNADQWANLFTEISADGKSPYQQDYANRLLPQGQSEDWQSSVFQSAYSQNHSLSINGGGSDYRYLLSFSYNDETGIVLNTGLERYIGRVNLDKDLYKNLNVGANITIGRTALQGLTNQGSSNTYNYAVRVSPLVPIYSRNSSDGYNYANPFETTDYRIGDKTPNPVSDLMKSTVETNNLSIIGNAYAQYTIIPQLVAKINTGLNLNHATQNFYAPSTSARGLLVNGYAGVGNKDYNTSLLEFTLNYKDVFAGIHSIEALAGYTTEHSEIEYSTAGASSFKNEALTYHSLQSGENRDTPTSGGAVSNLNSFLGRVNYSLQERYHLSISFRADGSSRFSKEHRWGYFPSVGVSWNIDKEPFFNEARKYLPQLKLRASAGQVGNQEIGDYLYSRLYTPRNYSFGNQIVVGYTATNYGNSELRWESTAQYNAGVDFGLFNNRLNIIVDAYYKLTSDLLVNLPVERTSGFRTKMTNIGNISNKGFEFSINTSIIDTKNLQWTALANIATNKNRIEKLGSSGFVSGSAIVDVGLPLGTFYGYVFDGIVQQGEEASAPVPTWLTGDKSVHAGDARFADRGGDPHSIDNNDRVALGNAQPDFTYGFSTQLKYRRFDFSASFQGSYGNKLYNALRNTLETPSQSYNGSAVLANRWTPANTNTNVPRAIPVPYTTIDSRYIEDASYLRLKDITLGYTLSLAKSKLSARLFVSTQNLFVLTKYTGYDPEGSRNGFSDLEIGVDNGVYPRAKTFLTGLSISF